MWCAGSRTRTGKMRVPPTSPRTGRVHRRLHKLVQDAASCRLFSFDQMGSSEDESSPADHARDERPGPFDHIEDAGFRGALAAAINVLPEREKMVLSLYYDEDMNLREIGEVLDVSESRYADSRSSSSAVARASPEWLQPN